MDFLLHLLSLDLLGKALWVWLLFAGVVATLLTFDLGVLHQDSHEIGLRESLQLSLAYITVALCFGAWVWFCFGAASGTAWLAGWAIEKSLSLDNVFVIALVFSYFGIPRRYQHRVLFWGVLGVIVLRGLLIAAGAMLVSQFAWVLELFAGFLVFSGIRMWIAAGHVPDIAGNPVLGVLRRHLRVTETLHGDAFWIQNADAKGGKPLRWVTPLFLALLLIEFVDLVFALDSIPATFAITTDPFLVYTSNIFAILGLRALYFALAEMLHRFRYLKYALALLLVFIGMKILAAGVIGELSPLISLAVTAGLIAGGVVLSLGKARRTSLESPVP